MVLQDDEHCPVVLIDGSVRRRQRWWTPAVHHLLAHLHDSGFAASPRVLGFDDEGREMLSFIEGDSGRDARRRVSSPKALANFAALLRRFHDAVRDYEPPQDAEWALPVPDRRQRVEIFAEAYGASINGLVEQVVARQQKYADDVEALAQRGLVTQWTTRESIERNHEIARWVAVNQQLFRE